MLGAFHPLIARWFEARFGRPTRPQAEGWPHIAAGRDTLIAAPTGSGKTLAAFLAALDRLVRASLDGALADETQVVYVSPLKALSNDVEKNLAEPLAEIAELAKSEGLELLPIHVAVRTGDTPASERARHAKKAPHILVTTPESLYILLTSSRARAGLAAVHTVIVDEIHAIADDKRGAHLALTLERLDALTLAERKVRPQRVGLSATQRPIELVGQFLAGARPLPAIVDAGFSRAIDLAVDVPSEALGPITSNEMMEELYDRIAALVREHRTTLVFVNTRKLVERVAHHLAKRLGDDQVAAHHGSLSRATRLRAEQRLKHAEVRCVVATASLELGIDVGAVELVVQVGSPRSIAVLLQRVGRSGHSLGATPKGRLFALTRDQLVECAALVRAVRKGELDRLSVPRGPLDVLAQQIVALVAADDWDEADLFALVRRAYPYRDLTTRDFEDVLTMLAEGIATEKGRARTYLHRDRIGGKLRARKGARITAITSGGAIPDNTDYAVIAEPDEAHVGSINEDFAIESNAGDVFLLGNTSWRIRRVEAGRVRVENAAGAPPSIPFWLGEAPARTTELSREVSELRAEVDRRLAGGEGAEVIARGLEREASLSAIAAAELVEYLGAVRADLGAMPTTTTIVAERFFDEAGGMQLVLHAPLGGRINRAWGLALRKRFCRSFNFELQAAATDDGVLISLGPVHSFPLETVFDFLTPLTVREVLEQAVLAAPVFGVRWRWNAQRALAVPRHSGKKKLPAPIMRMKTDDLLTAVFPMAQACLENVTGDIELPDHPLVRETMKDCLEEAMDLAGLVELLEAMRAGRVKTVARDTTEPSLLAHELLNANPYAFLDDAPLEERRARAVKLRGRGVALNAETAELGALDEAAIALAESEAEPEVRDAEELHDLLLTVHLLPEPSRDAWRPFFSALVGAGRAATIVYRAGSGAVRRAWIAAERRPLVEAALSSRDAPRVEEIEPALAPLPFEVAVPTAEAARVAIVRGHLELRGPVTSRALAEVLGLDVFEIEEALFALEAEGAILRGGFRAASMRGASGAELEWCDRRILARIHRLTLAKLRREIEPVTPAELMRFLFRWQHVAPGTQLFGRPGVLEVIAQLAGLELSAATWEKDVLPARVSGYDRALLDALTASGEVVWGRLGVRPAIEDGESGPRAIAIHRSIPIALALRDDLPYLLEPTASDASAAPSRGGAAPRRDASDRAVTRAARDAREASPRDAGVRGASHPDASDEAAARGDASAASLSDGAQAVIAHLERRGASFLREIIQGTGRLPFEVEDALRELVACGWVTADAFSALRALLDRRLGDELPTASARKLGLAPGARSGFGLAPNTTQGLGSARRGIASPGSESALPRFAAPSNDAPIGGRWSLLRRSDEPRDPETAPRRDAEIEARLLLARWGVVFRDLVQREPLLSPWREILLALRRMEARGEVRGGRFVGGFVGEQYALPEAVDGLRAVRRAAERARDLEAEGRPAEVELVKIAATAPLNLTGIITPGPRVPAVAGNQILHRNGVPIAAREAGEIQLRGPLPEGTVIGDDLTLRTAPASPATTTTVPQPSR